MIFCFSPCLFLLSVCVCARVFLDWSVCEERFASHIDPPTTPTTAPATATAATTSALATAPTATVAPVATWAAWTAAPRCGSALSSKTLGTRLVLLGRRHLLRNLVGHAHVLDGVPADVALGAARKVLCGPRRAHRALQKHVHVRVARLERPVVRLPALQLNKHRLPHCSIQQCQWKLYLSTSSIEKKKATHFCGGEKTQTIFSRAVTHSLTRFLFLFIPVVFFLKKGRQENE